jgi:hypothetical protein
VGLLQTPAQSLGVQAPAKERAGFNSPDIGGGVGVALRIALFGEREEKEVVVLAITRVELI